MLQLSFQGGRQLDPWRERDQLAQVLHGNAVMPERSEQPALFCPGIRCAEGIVRHTVKDTQNSTQPVVLCRPPALSVRPISLPSGVRVVEFFQTVQ